MNACLILHSATGQVLFSQDDSLEHVLPQSNGTSKSPDSPSMCASARVVLLSGYVCALSSNLHELSAAPTHTQQPNIQTQHVHSIQTATGKIHFIKSNQSPIIVALFSKDVNPEVPLHWLIARIHRAFVSQFAEQLAAKPFRVLAKQYRSFQSTLDEIFFHEYLAHLTQHLIDGLSALVAPSWMYVYCQPALLASNHNKQHTLFTPKPPKQPAPPSAAAPARRWWHRFFPPRSRTASPAHTQTHAHDKPSTPDQQPQAHDNGTPMNAQPSDSPAAVSPTQLQPPAPSNDKRWTQVIAKEKSTLSPGLVPPLLSVLSGSIQLLSCSAAGAHQNINHIEMNFGEKNSPSSFHCAHVLAFVQPFEAAFQQHAAFVKHTLEARKREEEIKQQRKMRKSMANPPSQAIAITA